MQTVCKPKPWQQLLLQLKTLLAFCFHWHSLATTFFTGPIIRIQINYRLQYHGKEVKRPAIVLGANWAKTKTQYHQLFLQLEHRALKGRYISSNAFNGNRSVHLLNYICFVVVIVVVVFLKMYTVFSHPYYQTPKKCRCMQIYRVCQPLYVSMIDL